MDNHKKTPVLYLGIFAVDPKTATKTVRGICKDGLLEVLKHCRPEAYLIEGEHLQKGEELHDLEK